MEKFIIDQLHCRSAQLSVNDNAAYTSQLISDWLNLFAGSENQNLPEVAEMIHGVEQPKRKCLKVFPPKLSIVYLTKKYI